MSSKESVELERAIRNEEPNIIKRATGEEKSMREKRVKKLKEPIRSERASPVKEPKQRERVIHLKKSNREKRAIRNEKTASYERVKIQREIQKEESMKSDFSSLPTMVDAQLTIEKLRIELQIRRTHLKRNGRNDPETDELMERLNELEAYVDKRVSKLIEDHPAYPWFSKVKGIGRENIAKVIGLIDITKAPHISSLWQFAGYGKDEKGRIQKRRKGETASYCGLLRVMCWRLGKNLMQAKDTYYDYYLKEKARYIARARNQDRQIVPTKDLPIINGTRSETDQYISEGHIHNMAFRKMIKLFLSHLWLEWRKGMGLPISEPYAKDQLGHTHIIDPWDMVSERRNSSMVKNNETKKI